MRRFLMRLALSEGRITKWRELYDELTPRDLAELDAFHRLEPWGDARDDLRHAVMTATIVAAISGREIEITKLAHYLGDEQETVLTPDQAAARFARRR